MRSFVAVLALATVCLAGESRFNQRGYSQATDLESFNADIMERLRQQPGSERKVYHVYLPDGRLQRVQYTAAPVSTSQQGQSQYDAESPSGPDASQQAPVNAYYVEVPEERYQQLRASQRQTYQQQQVSDYEQDSLRSSVNAYYVEVPAERYEQLSSQISSNQQQQQQYQPQQQADWRASEPLVVKSQFAPLEVITVEQLAAQYKAQHPY